MIRNDQELRTTLDRIAHFQAQVARIREVETDPQNYHACVSGYLAELDRMNIEVREYLWTHPQDFCRAPSSGLPHYPRALFDRMARVFRRNWSRSHVLSF
jgi:hypothetical protein